MLTAAATVENSTDVPRETKTKIATRSSDPTSEHVSEGNKTAISEVPGSPRLLQSLAHPRRGDDAAIRQENREDVVYMHDAQRKGSSPCQLWQHRWILRA